MSQHTSKASQPDGARRAAGAPPTDKAIPDTPATAIPLTSWRPEMSVKAALGQEKVFVKLPFVGAVDLPSGPHLVWYGGGDRARRPRSRRVAGRAAHDYRQGTCRQRAE